jgi:hypothetical protein
VSTRVVVLRAALGTLPAVTALALLTVVGVLLVKPRAAATMASRMEIRTLETRAGMLRGILSRSTESADRDVGALEHDIGEKLRAEDRTPELVERLAAYALEQGGPSEIRALLIETGEAVRHEPPGTAALPRAAGSLRQPDDPRLALFRTPLVSTPVTLTAETTAERIAGVLWRVNQLPALCEVKSLEIESNRPLVKVRLELRALRREELLPSVAAPSQIQGGAQAGPRPPVAPASPPAAGGDGILALSRLLALPMPPAVDLSAPPRWSRDPFLTPGEKRRSHAGKVAASTAPEREPSVRSILFSSGRRLAIVNGRIVGIGEQIDGYRVIDIERETVVFGTPAGQTVRVGLRVVSAGDSR